MLEAFDAPNMEPNCERRTSSTVATQSLTMLNSQFIINQSKAFAERVLKDAGENANADQLIQTAWKLALADSPSDEELAAMQNFLREQLPNAEDAKPEERTAALAALCQVLLNSNRFLYID